MDVGGNHKAAIAGRPRRFGLTLLALVAGLALALALGAKLASDHQQAERRASAWRDVCAEINERVDDAAMLLNPDWFRARMRGQRLQYYANAPGLVFPASKPLFDPAHAIDGRTLPTCRAAAATARSLDAELRFSERDHFVAVRAVQHLAGNTDAGSPDAIMDVGLAYDTPDSIGLRLAMQIGALSLGLAAVAGVGIAILFMNSRLGRLTQVLRQAAGGDLKARAPHDDTGTEFGALAGELNGALSRLEVQFTDLAAARARIEDHVVALSIAEARAGHELLAPLRRVLSRIDVLSMKDLSDDARAELQRVRARLEAAETAANSLLDMAREDGAAPRPQIDLTELVEAVAGEERQADSAAPFEVHLSLERNVSVLAHRNRVRVLLSNLLRNASKYASSPEARISLSSFRGARGREFRLEIANDSDLPAEGAPTLKALFERGAAAPDQPGHGLGLDTANAIATLHGFMFDCEVREREFVVWMTGVVVESRDTGACSDTGSPARA